MPDQLEVRRCHDAHGVLVGLEGELDLATAPRLERELRDIAAAQPGRIGLDLGELAFMDCTGIAVMVRAQQAADFNGHRLALLRVPGHVRRLLTLTGLSEQFDFES